MTAIDPAGPVPVNATRFRLAEEELLHLPDVEPVGDRLNGRRGRNVGSHHASISVL